MSEALKNYCCGLRNWKLLGSKLKKGYEMKKYIFKLLFLLTIFGCNTKESEVYILPENYTGYFVIIFGQDNGLEKKYKNGKRIYEIPPAGILKTQFEADYGRSDFPEFYYRNIQEENKIPYSYDFENLADDKVVGFGGRSGVANRNLKGDSVVGFREFYIGTKSQIEVAVKEVEQLDIISLINKK